MNPLDLLITALATFYLAYAVSATHGPGMIFKMLRERVPLGGLTGCLVCLSPWFGAVCWLALQTVFAPVVGIFAIGGASVLLWRYSGGNYVSN
jgi:hypothetical protein